MLSVILYIRKNCHLCEEVKGYLKEFQNRYPHQLTIIDIDDDPELVRRFGGYDGIGIAIFIPYHGTELRTYAIKHDLLPDKWISADGYLLGGSALKMPNPYLQRAEIW